MKTFIATCAIACFSTAAALAQSGPTTLSMTCEQARSIVASQGAVVLHTGPRTYDRYVRSSQFCALQETARLAWVPAADVAQCPVGRVCRQVEIENGR